MFPQGRAARSLFFAHGTGAAEVENFVAQATNLDKKYFQTNIFLICQKWQTAEMPLA